MRLGTISARMLLAALAPVTLIVLWLVGVFLVARMADNDEAHSQRGRSLARQIAAASEYGLFSGNQAFLQSLVRGAMREADVRSVAILDVEGRMLASAGNPGYAGPPSGESRESEQSDPRTGNRLLSQPIFATQVKLDDLFELQSAQVPTQRLGQLLLELSRDRLKRQERQMLLAGAVVALGSLLLGGLLAVRLGRGVIRPILRVSDMIERLGSGELTVRAQTMPEEPLHEVLLGLNRMAQKLQSGRDELEQRVELATVALRQQKDEAESATQAKSRFLAVASHDLRQPAHALGMFVARLAQLHHSTEATQLIEKLELAVESLQELLDGLLDISRLDAGAVQLHVQPIALAGVFEQMRHEMEGIAIERGLRLRVRATSAWVSSDPTLLNRILLNLLGNALRYTARGGVLLVCRHRANASVARIEVWDTGIGIAPEHQRAVFEEFYQIDGASRERSKGMGLGLNIVQRAANLLGHPLQLHSQPGRGTRFCIDLPLLPSPEGPPAERRRLPRGDGFDDLGGQAVMVIEDNVLECEALVALLQGWGGTVWVADGLESALRCLSDALTIDLIISDFHLGENHDGVEVVRELRAAAVRNIPACLISGNTDQGAMQAAQQAQLTLLHKPVRPAKLRSLVRHLLLPDQRPDGLT